MPNNDPFVLAGREYRSRLIVGTGKYRSFEETRAAIEAAGAEIVTVAVRRVNITDPGDDNLLDHLPLDRFTILPNTAGCYTAEDAVRTARLAREAGVGTLREARGDRRREDALPRRPGDARGRRAARGRGLPGAAVRHRRPDRLQAPRGHGLRRGDAAGGADRLGARHPQPVQPAHHPRAEPRAGDRRRRRRHGVGRGRGAGARLRRGADEHRDRRRARSRC